MNNAVTYAVDALMNNEELGCLLLVDAVCLIKKVAEVVVGNWSKGLGATLWLSQLTQTLGEEFGPGLHLRTYVYFTSASSDHIFGIILYPLHVKSKMWSEPHFQGFLVNSTIFTLRRLRILE
jgi:hypothetical protein